MGEARDSSLTFVMTSKNQSRFFNSRSFGRSITGEPKEFWIELYLRANRKKSLVKVKLQLQVKAMGLYTSEMSHNLNES